MIRHDAFSFTLPKFITNYDDCTITYTLAIDNDPYTNTDPVFTYAAATKNLTVYTRDLTARRTHTLTLTARNLVDVKSINFIVNIDWDPC